MTNKNIKLLSLLVLTAILLNSYLIYIVVNKGEAPSLSGSANVVSVDLDAVFNSHSGRRESQKAIDAKAKGFTDEIEQLKKSSVEGANALEKKRQEVLLIEDKKKRAEQEAELVEEIKKLRQFELQVAEKARGYQEQIAKDSAAAANKILDEIYILIERKSKALGYTQVINEKAADKNGVPVILYNHDTLDFTSLLINEVNKSE